MDITKNFVHLHVHSYYSINDGISSVKELVDKAIDCNMSGMALTDHGNMYGIKEFFDYVSRVNKDRMHNGKEPFKAILGCELYVAKNGCKEQKNGIKVTMFAVGNAAELYPGSTLRGCEPLAVRHSLGVFHRSGCAL